MARIKQIPESVLKATILLIAVIGLSPQLCYGQKDTVKTYKNTIRINITNPMLFSPKCNIIGYERVIKDYQTASVNVGRFFLPKFTEFDNDSIGISEQFHDKGFNFSLDYRFYLQKENKYVAPRGIYLGPYYGFNYFSRDLTWDLNTSNYTGEVENGLGLMANLVGLQMGYQFVLWNRMSIDLILMGPGVWFFNLKSDFNTSLTDEDESDLLEELNNMLKEKFPGSDFVIKGKDFEAKKITHTSVMGYRYMINLGFRF